MTPTPGREIPRRSFVKAAVAIGGSAALAACLGREEPGLPRGVDDPSTLPERQHAWNAALATDDHGNAVAPRHHALLFLDFARENPPTDADRQRIGTALSTLERAYPRSHEGLLSTVGYSPAYFGRFDAPLPESVDLPEPRALAPFEEPKLDRPDAALHLASDYGSVVLACEAALFGERESLNGVGVESTFEGVLERAERRTGFVGTGLPAENQDVAGIPDSKPVDAESPLFMGFKSGFRKNQATEDRVTIPDGPFAGGTTQHVSRIRLNLDQWYGQDSREQRVAKMFCPVHAEQGLVEETGENLGDESRMGDECIEGTAEHARTRGVVGHSQKAAGARRDGTPVILRRDFDSTDDGEAGLHFVAVQRTITDFEDTREAMNGTALAGESAVGQRNNNGILQYMTVQRRANFLVPPRTLRALPDANPG